ncbi:Gmad2 immunoglobulin-like domain-containing protein [Patescibacteria group bacterium]
MKKTIFILGVIILLIIGVLAIRFIFGGPEDAWICVNGEWQKHGVPSGPAPNRPCGDELIGGQRDEHGCLGPAGYQWCPSTEKCQRMWEEYCEEFKDQFRGEAQRCDSFAPEICPQECVVCPPCAACSSISCQTEEFCANLGIDRTWYEEIKKNMEGKITNFQECIEAGNPAMESYPRQCRAGDQTFTENIGNEQDKQDLIKLDNPRPNQKVTSPLTIKGQARGYWFFEGDFPIVLTNWDGLIIAEGYATADGEWMTEDFVAFEAELTFDASDELYKRGSLILQKDNPSGLPENDDALEIPVLFE